MNDLYELYKDINPYPYSIPRYNNLYDFNGGMINYNGNIDLANRPVVENDDGSVSTVASISINDDGKEVLIPTAINGKLVTPEEAIEEYLKNGKYLGKFDSVDDADWYAQQLHKQQEQTYKW